MNRYIDVFFTVLGVFVLSFILCGLLTAKFAVKLTVSFLVSIAAVCLIAFLVRGGRRGFPDYRSFVTYCILSDEEKIAALFEKTGLIKSAEISDGVYPAPDGAACLYLKFSKPSRDYIVTLYKNCVKNKIKKLTVWCAAFERAGVAIACTLPEVEIRFRTLRPLFKKVKKQRLLSGEDIRPAQRPTLKTLIPIVFNTKNSYRFAVVAVVLYAFSLLTPLKAYYITVATVALVLAVIARFVGERSDGNA